MTTNATLTAKQIAQITRQPKSTVRRRAKREGWEYIERRGPGGMQVEYMLASLPHDLREAYHRQTNTPPETLPACIELDVSAGFSTLMKNERIFGELFGDGVVIDEKARRKPSFRRNVQILEEVNKKPPGVKRRQWIENIAVRYDLTYQTIYDIIRKHEKAGLSGLEHRKGSRGSAKKWTPEAVDYWLGLCLKREHRKIDKKALYQALESEAYKQGWSIGGYKSALWWFKKRVTPTLQAYQKGGMRALDNILPPIIRNYSDLEPFEMLVGDQHRFDFWVVDEDTNEIFRPECYLWQDLRTRAIYGVAVDRRYDSHLIGLALLLGIHMFGTFGSIYTDNGKPEISKYLMGIMQDMRNLNLSREAEIDAPLTVSGVDPEELNPCVIPPGTHKKAIVKNAKAKLIESTFGTLEGILRSRFKLPGYVKELGGDIHENDIDESERNSLIKSGKLLRFSEFIAHLLSALDYYNNRSHRGVLKEWAWKPIPKSASPYDCLKACMKGGWMPQRISADAASLIFLARTNRVVNKGRVRLDGELFEHDKLINVTGERVQIRYNPMQLTEVIVFHNEEYLCTAIPVSYASMKVDDLTRQKVEEKRARRKKVAHEFQNLTKNIPDLRNYSESPRIEHQATLFRREKNKRQQEEAELNRLRTPEELEAEVREQIIRGMRPTKPPKPPPERPMYFMDDLSRYEWCVKYELAGGELDDNDRAWKTARDAAMDDGERRYWDAVREYGGM